MAKAPGPPSPTPPAPGPPAGGSPAPAPTPAAAANELTDVIKQLGQMPAVLQDFAQRMNLVSGQAVAGFTTLTATTTHTGDALHALLGPIERIESQFGAVVNQSSKFIAAFNPSLLEVFNQALRSLHATVGYALEPVITLATEGIREFAGAIRPAMDALRGPMQQMAQAILPIISAALQSFGAALTSIIEVLNTLMPVIKLVLAVFEGLMTLLSVGIRILAAFVSALTGAIDLGGIDSAVEAVKSVFASMAMAMVSVVDGLLRMVGATGMADKILRSLAAGPRENQGRAPAPQNVQIGGVEDVYRHRLTEAAKAGGGASPLERQVSIMEDVREHVKGILANSERSAGQLDGMLGGVVDLVRMVSNVVGFLLSPRRWFGG